MTDAFDLDAYLARVGSSSASLKRQISRMPRSDTHRRYCSKTRHTPKMTAKILIGSVA